MPTTLQLSRLPPLEQVPDKRRYVKDCLRVGTWYTGQDASGRDTFWTVTPEMLDEFEKNFNEQLAAGFKHPMQWGHNPDKSFGEAAREKIANIRNLWREGDTLYLAVYLDQYEADDLIRRDQQVSIRAVEKFAGEGGHFWGPSIVHVAIVDHGAVPSQDTFVELSSKMSARPLFSVPNQRGFAVSDNKSGRNLAASLGPGTMDFLKLVELINVMLAKISPNAALPTEGENAVTEETLLPTLEIVLNALGEATATEPVSDPVTDVIDVEDIAPTDLSAKIARAVTAAITPVMRDLSAKINAVSKQQNAGKAAAFKAATTALGHAGIPAATVKGLVDLGAKTGWDMGILAPYNGVKGLRLGSQTKSLSASLPGEFGGMTEAKKAEVLKMVGISPAKK